VLTAKFLYSMPGRRLLPYLLADVFSYFVDGRLLPYLLADVLSLSADVSTLPPADVLSLSPDVSTLLLRTSLALLLADVSSKRCQRTSLALLDGGRLFQSLLADASVYKGNI
jgi:hypothetical protein